MCSNQIRKKLNFDSNIEKIIEKKPKTMAPEPLTTATVLIYSPIMSKQWGASEHTPETSHIYTQHNIFIYVYRWAAQPRIIQRYGRAARPGTIMCRRGGGIMPIRTRLKINTSLCQAHIQGRKREHYGRRPTGWNPPLFRPSPCASL